MSLFARWTEPFSHKRQTLELMPEHIEGFRRAQSLAYTCAAAVEGRLCEGITEREVAKVMAGYLADHGVRHYFHTPFVWFGDRTAFRNFRSGFDFAPSGRRLEMGDPVILDVAPVVDGHAADIGYSCAFGDNPLHRQIVHDLVEYRALILDSVRAGRTRSEIYRAVDRLIRVHGYQNRHRKYPGHVLGHRVTWTPARDLSARTLMGFGAQSVGSVIAGKIMQRYSPGFDSYLWNGDKTCDQPATPGLWAIEPHVGFRGIGAKWEEILVVTPSDAYWLDDDVPHVRRSRAKAATGPVGDAPRAPAMTS